MIPRRCPRAGLAPASALLLLLLSLSAPSLAQLTFTDGPVDEDGVIPQIVVTHEDGMADAQLEFAFETPEGEIYEQTTVTPASGDVITSTDLFDMELEGGVRNITTIFQFEALPGDEEFTITTTTISDPEDESTRNTYQLTGSFRVVGLVLRGADGSIISGMGNNFMTGNLSAIEETNGFYEFEVISVSETGDPIDPESFEIVVNSPMNEIAYSPADCPPVLDEPTEACGVGFSNGGDTFFVQLDVDNLGPADTPTQIILTNPSITDERSGMEFMQQVNIVVDATDFSPTMITREIVAVDPYGGEFFNFEGRLFPDDTSSASLTVGSTEWTLAPDFSSFGDEGITLSFDTAPAGEDETSVDVTGGTFTTDGDAMSFITSEDPFVVQIADRDLAEVGTFTADEAAGFSWYQIGISLSSYTAGTFSQSKNSQIIARLADNAGIGTDRIRLESVDSPDSTARVAVFDLAKVGRQEGGVVPTYGILYGENAEEASDSTADYITSGMLAEAIFMRGDNVGLADEPSLFAGPGDVTPSPIVDEDDGGGLPVWARVVIGVAAGLLGLLLIGCCLFFFLGRDRDEDASTEPSFTVEGPASVPVPVEYPVVRDAFGRGHYEAELGSGEVDPAAGLPVEHPRINSSL